MTKMFPSTAPQSILKKKKCVRFDDRVTVKEIEQQIGMSNGSTEANYNSSGARSSVIICSNHIILSSSSGSKKISHRTRYRNSRRGPNRIPLMRFNSLPVPAKSSLLPARSYSGQQWRRPGGCQQSRMRNASLPPSAPIRLPSIDKIIRDHALAIVEGKHNNHVWNHCDVCHVLAAECGRWKEASQNPPKIPRRKISLTSFKKDSFKKGAM